MGGLIMESYETLIKGGTDGPVIALGNSSESRLVAMLEGTVKPRMPFEGEALPPEDIETIKVWIDAGAPRGTLPTTAPLAPSIPDIKPQIPEVSPVGSLVFSPDAKLLAVGGYKDVRLFNPVNGRVLGTLTNHAELVRALAFSRDGTLLAAGGGLPARSGEVKLWNVQSRQPFRTLLGHKDCVYSVAISPDKRLLASGSYDKFVKLWDVESGREVSTLKDHIDAVFAVTFSPDGKRLATGSQDRTVKVWDVASGQRQFTLSDALDSITTVAFHPSGDQLVAGGADKTIWIWNLTAKGGSLAQSILAHEDTILSLLYSPDGKTIISTSADRTIKVWDAATFNLVKVLEKQPDWVQAVAISPDGRWLAAGRDSGSLSIYDLAIGTEILGPLLAFEPFPATTEKAERQSVHR
jgi:WD40 repeat protein